jgi:hypothetical protein
MKRDEFGLKPPYQSFVDMIERLSDGLHVDVVNRRDADEPSPRVSPTAGENNRPFYRSNRDGRD